MKKILILIFILILSTLGANIARAYEIGDPDDIFYVTAPAANAKVSGTINISWRMWDDDQSTIQYTAKLFDAASCENVNYGTINSNLNGASNQNSDNTLAWNTNNTQSSTNLPDGNYCLQVCAAMKNGAASYSACNSRIVKIVNHNTLPVITSNPTNLTIKESQSWSYQVTAFDSDNDPLAYNLVYSTNFLNINPQTGLIQTNGNSKVLPDGINQANYRIVVSVNDGISGSATQEFTLSVVRDNPVVTPPSSNPPSTNPPTTNPPTEQPTDNTTNHPTKIDILYPTDNSILIGADNQIKWDITDQDGLKKITLEYSKDNDKGWVLIKNLESDQEVASNTYTWDVSKIVDDIYYLKITVVDKKNGQANRVSDNFLIKNNNQETQSQPLIINLQPESNGELKSNTPKLSADFIPSGSAKVVTNTVKIILNDVDITSKCTTAETGFTCELTQPLEDGKHSVNVTYKDSDGKIASLNWTFNINTKPEEQTLTQDNVTILGREIPKNSLIILVALSCIFLLLLIIPWVLYRNWKKNKNKDTSGPTEFGGGFTPTPDNLSNLGQSRQEAFSPINQQTFQPTPIQSTPTMTPQPRTMEPTVSQQPSQFSNVAPQNVTQTPEQQAIEKSLMDYWSGQGNPLPQPEQPIQQPAQPKVVQPQVGQPTTPLQPTAPQSTYPTQPFQEVTTPEDTSFTEPTPTDN